MPFRMIQPGSYTRYHGKIIPNAIARKQWNEMNDVEKIFA